MNTSVTSRIAWLVWGLSLAGLVVVMTIGFVSPPSGDADFSNTVGFTVFLLSSSSVGALLSARKPENPIGWIFLAVSLFGIVAGLVTVLDGDPFDAATVREGSLVEWIGNWIWTLAFAPVILVLLLFPTGKPLSPRWRFVVWGVGAGLAVATISYAFAPGRFDNSDEPITNPYGLEALDIPLGILAGVGGALIIGGLFASMVSLVLRFKRSKGVERQQLKWLAYAAGVVIAVFVLTIPIETGNQNDPRVTDLVNSMFIVVVTGIPISVGVAILRYRLYDIDRIISRTVSYGLLTVLLAAAYLAGVLLVQSTLPVADDSPVTIAASTLGMVALFRPLRNRIQGIVDRRFNRRRFDAIRTIDDFSARLRAETNLDSLSTDLVGVVRDTMQPTHVSLWLHPNAAALRQRSAAQ